MKKLLKVSLLFASIPLALSSCTDIGDRIICVETSNTTDYVENMCCQISYKQVVDTVYLITPPLNPEAALSEQTFDFIWKDELKNAYFDFVDGLKGKQLISVLKISNNILKLNIKGSCDDPLATYGYVKIFRHAYISQTNKIKNENIYAYVSVGEQGSILVDKPALNNDGTIAK